MAYEVPSEMRDFAEKSVDQARKAFEGFIGAAQKAAGAMEATPFPLPVQMKDMGAKAMSFAETNVKAAFDLAQKLVHAKDIQEVLTLQSDYVRTQMVAIQEQARELGAVARSDLPRR
ncbi:MAG: phasin [Methylobacteriaceae bacterium]|nr:phasin [Methylobacteriaceae bacterium]